MYQPYLKRYQVHVREQYNTNLNKDHSRVFDTLCYLVLIIMAIIKITLRLCWLIGVITIVPYGIWWVLTGLNLYEAEDLIDSL